MLELDQRAQVITYEEYYPYGSTSYQAVRSRTETPKRYRYTGKERDTETGLSYHGARYYAPWLARWTSCDPAGLTDGTNLYAYGRDNPVVYRDPRGTDGQDSTKPPQPAGSAQAPTAPAPTPTGTPAATSGAAPPATADDMQHHDPPQLHSTLSTTTQSAGQPPAEKIEKEASGQASASGTTGGQQSGRQRRSRRGHRVPRGRRQGRQRRCDRRSPVQPWWTADRRGRGRYRGGRQRSARSG